MGNDHDLTPGGCSRTFGGDLMAIYIKVLVANSEMRGRNERVTTYHRLERDKLLLSLS